MKVFIFVSLITIFLLPQISLCQGKTAKLSVDPKKYTFTNYYEDKEFYIEFTEKELNNTPAWNPENAPPPISVDKAVKESRKFLGKYVSRPEEWEVESVKLAFTGQNKCIYVIDFYLDGSNAKNGHSATFTTVLKMDGTFFLPKVTQVK